jgi:hypothetical protein
MEGARWIPEMNERDVLQIAVGERRVDQEGFP